MWRSFFLSLTTLCACQPANQGAIVKPTPSAQITPPPSMLPTSSSNFPLPAQSPFENTVVEIAAGTGEKGFQDGPAEQATFNSLAGISHDPRTGDLYLMDTHKIRKLSANGQVTTVAGQEEPGFQDDPAEQAKFHGLNDCAVDSQGNVYLADASNRRIRILTKEGQVQTVAGNGKTEGTLDGPALESRILSSLSRLALNTNGVLYFSDAFRIRLLENGMIKTLNAQQTATASKENGYKDGSIQEATFGESLYLTFDPENNLYIADQPQQVLRKVDSNQTVSTVVRKHIFAGEPSLSRPLSIDYLPQKKAILIVDANLVQLSNTETPLAIVINEYLFSGGAYGLSDPYPFQWKHS